MKIFFEKFVKYFLIASLFTPLFFFPAIWSNFIFPFVVPKILFFRSMVLLMLAGYLVLFFIDAKKYAIKNTPLTLAIIGFFLSFILSTFLGVDWYRSFWDNHERMLGLFTFAHYVLWYLIATTVFRTKEEWRTLWLWFLSIASVVMLMGVYQKIDPQAFLNQGNARVSGSLGNAIYFAGLGLFLGFTGLLFALQEKNRWWKNIFFFLSLLGVLGIFLSSTRGTLLGLLVGGSISVALYFWYFQNNLPVGHSGQKIKNIFLSVTALFVIGLCVLFYFRTTPLVRDIPALGRLLNSAQEIQERSPRLMAWGLAIESWKEKPIFGWGPNNFYYSFNKYYLPEFLNFGYGETWFDNAHNIVLNTLAVQGILGLILYLTLFVFSIRTLWKKYRAGDIGIHVAFLGIGFVVAHFVHNIFVFENPTSYLSFFFFLAFINTIGNRAEETKEKEDKKTAPWWKIGVVFAVILFFLYTTNINPARANMATFSTLQSFYSGDRPVEQYKETVAISTPHIDDVRNDFARTIVSVLPKYVEVKRTDDINQLFDLAYADLKKNVALHPLDVRAAMQLAQLAQVGTQFLNRSALIPEGEQVLTRALEASPKRQQIQYMLSLFSLQLGNVQKAENLLLDSIKNSPKIEEGWWRLAFLYAQTGQKQKANDLLAEAKKQGVVIPEDKKQWINDILTQIGATGTGSLSP